MGYPPCVTFLARCVLWVRRERYKGGMSYCARIGGTIDLTHDCYDSYSQKDALRLGSGNYFLVIISL